MTEHSSTDAAARAAAPAAPPPNDPREIFGWLAYDWANSAFYTTVVGALLGPYLTAIAQSQLGENGVIFDFGWGLKTTAKSFFPHCVFLAVGLQALLLPLLGAAADYSHAKKRLMAVFCYTGVAANCLLFFVTGELYLLGGLLFIIATICFGASIVFYNAYLVEITTEDLRDKISSRGFAFGYLGGGLLLALNLLLVVGAGSLGMSQGMAVRVSMLSAGVWWGGFAVITFRRLRSRAPARALPPNRRLLTVGFAELGSTFRELARLPRTLRFLLAYLFYNDGVQTVIHSASLFIAQELFVSRGVETPQAFLLGIFLFVQFVAFGGALLFERVARAVGAKAAIMLSLVIWSGIVVYAYTYFSSVTEAWVMAGFIAVVLGGSQALSRSLFSRMIPRGREASFFGIYEISECGTSWIGPLVFGLVAAHTNSYRHAILSLVVFFVVGLVILYFTDTDRAIRDAGNALPEEAAKSRES